ncbi:MAG: hypothetical protein JXR48_03065 [Candidatus Delongbacteria bacterium]|nr:hypothetical protein [Candidatus Delongbacteria bacterium]MBN2833929.1 hypothetical protein [Candidatus Delongbacteria bacterium]
MIKILYRLKYIYPSIFISMFFFIYGLLKFKQDYFVDEEQIYQLYSTIAIYGVIYIIIGFVLGFISFFIFSQDKKRNLYEKNQENYFYYFLKSSLLSLFIIEIVIVRGMINQPAIYPDNLFLPWFIKKFFIYNFSPLYFSVIIAVFLTFLIYNIYKKMDDFVKNKTIYLSIPSILFLLLIFFNYGFLNASYKGKNIFLILAEDFNSRFLSKRYEANLTNLSIFNKGYSFDNFFNISNDKYATLASILNMKNPDNSGVFSKLSDIEKKNQKKENRVFELLENRGAESMVFCGNNYDGIINFLPDKYLVFENKKNDDIKPSMIYFQPLIWNIMNNQYLVDYFEEIKFIKNYSHFEIWITDLEKKISSDNSINSIFCLSKRDMNIFPYFQGLYRDSLNTDYLYHKMIDDQLGIIFDTVKKKGEFKNSVFAIVSLPTGIDKNYNLKFNDLRSNFYIYQEGMNELNVKNNYCSVDVYSTIFDLTPYSDIKDSIGYINGISFLDSVYTKQDIIIRESIESFVKRIENKATLDNFMKKDFYPKSFKSIYDIFSRKTYIYGNYKLDILPGPFGVDYRLYNISDDPNERAELSESHPKTLDFMISRLKKIYIEEYGYSEQNEYLYRDF